MLFRRYILLFLTLLSLSLQGQQYPVDIQVFATPPYPQSLRGYADTFEEKLQAHFLLKDLSTGGRPFVLRLSLENFQGQVIAQTPDYIAPYLLNLTPGVRRTLSNIDFKSLLKYENLYGINESSYNGLLPEGTYFLCLSLYDSATGRPVSNKGRAMLQVRRYAPPIPTMPQKGEVLTKKNAFQHIVFQWMPRDIAPFMQYEFTLKEVWDLSLVPEEAFMTGRLVYQTQTYAPALAYTNMMPILLENKRYVWQVRAFTNNPNNPNEPSYFKNNGNSETFYFDLVSHCEAPKFLTAISESTSAQLRWSAQAMMPNQEYPYKVMYRERGKSWKSQKVSMPNAKLTGLKRGRTYIYKVGVACGLNATHSSSVFGQESYMYSTEQEFTTTEQIDQKSQVQCGVKPQVRIKNTSPLQDNLYPNTTFTAGDFPVTVLNATGSNGVYSGEGYVKVPYLQDTKIKVSFTNIKLNTEHQLIDGKLVTTYDQTERNVQFVQEGIGEVFGDKGKKDQKMPFEIENQNNIQVDSISGRITITGKVDPKTGIAPKVTLPKGRDYVITDSKGKVYQLDENGKVTAQGTREEGTQLAQQAGKGDSKNPPIDNKHFKVEWLFNDELATDLTGDIPYKVLVKGKTSSFELRIQPADTTKYDFFFHTENGVKVDAESKGDGLYKITRKGAFDFAQEELWVVAKEKKDKKGKKEELIGKCILVHLSPKEVNVALVPTQSGQNLQEAIAQVQQIYEKVGVTLHITTEKPFDISDQLKNGTLPTENEFGDLSTYSPEQNAVIAKFATNRKPKENTYYIFLVNDGTGDHGYMRLGGQYGFVYSTNARTIAHELGHGIFKLEHPFKGKNADKGKTTALMDYKEGQDFFYRDWKQINDPKVKLYAFQGQKEGKSEQAYRKLSLQRLLDWLRNNKGKVVDYKGIDSSFYLSSAAGESDISFTDGKGTIYMNAEIKHSFGKIDLRESNNVINRSGFYVDLGYYHAQFYMSIYYPKGDKREKEAVITLYTRSNKNSYNYFKRMLAYIGCEMTVNSKKHLIKQYKEYLDKSNYDPDKIDVLFETIPNFVISELSEDTLVKSLVSLSKSNLSHFFIEATDEEEAILNIIRTLGSRNPDLLLDTLINPAYTRNGFTLFQTLFENMDNVGGKDNFNIFITLLYNFWKSSKYSKQETQYQLPYVAEKTIGFYTDNIRTSIVNDQILLRSNNKTYLDKFLYFSFYDKIDIIDVQGKKVALPLPTAKIPMFYLHALREVGKGTNAETAIGLSLDGITSVTGIGNLTKLRHLSRMVKATRIAIGSIEIGTGVTNMILTMSSCDSDFCERLRMYLFWLEIGTLSVDDFTQGMIRKSAKEALEALPSINTIDKKIVQELERVAGVKTQTGKLSAIEKEISKGQEFVNKVKKLIYRNVSYEDFIKTFKATDEQHKIAFKLWGEEKWDELYKFFKENRINEWNGIVWPPYSGFSKVNKTIPANEYTLTIDRFQKETSLGGGFGSPILRNGEGVESLAYTYDSRMLSDKLDDGVYYFSFRMSDKASDVQLKIGDVAPWFSKNQNLAGEQIEFSQKLHMLDANYFNSIEAQVRINGEWRKCVIEGKSVVTEIQDVLNKLPKNIADDIVDFINIEKSRLQYFKNAQKTGKLDRAIEAYKIYKKNKQKIILCP